MELVGSFQISNRRKSDCGISVKYYVSVCMGFVLSMRSLRGQACDSAGRNSYKALQF